MASSMDQSEFPHYHPERSLMPGTCQAHCEDPFQDRAGDEVMSSADDFIRSMQAITLCFQHVPARSNRSICGDI